MKPSYIKGEKASVAVVGISLCVFYVDKKQEFCFNTFPGSEKI